MARYNKEIVQKITELVRSDSYTVIEICKQVGITPSTYYDWISRKPEFSESLKKAKDHFRDTMNVEAKRSLRKLVCGYTFKEVKTVTIPKNKKYEPGESQEFIEEVTVVEKHVPASIEAIIFTLTNGDPDNWKNRLNINLDLKADITGSVPIKEWLRSKAVPLNDKK